MRAMDGRTSNEVYLKRVGRVPTGFLILALCSFAVGVAAAPLVVGDIAEFFYQPMPLALVHAFTLGWITSGLMGLMYERVPALTRRSVPFPRLAMVQLLLFILARLLKAKK